MRRVDLWSHILEDWWLSDYSCVLHCSCQHKRYDLSRNLDSRRYAGKYMFTRVSASYAEGAAERRTDVPTLTITVLSTVTVTSGTCLSERDMTSYAFCVEHIHIIRRCSTTSYTISAIHIRLVLLPECYVVSMLVCITINRTYYRSDGHVATHTDTIRYLGLHLDSALSGNEHIAHTKQNILPVI